MHLVMMRSVHDYNEQAGRSVPEVVLLFATCYIQVYAATWHQTHVAVKVLQARTEGAGAQGEALRVQLNHAHLHVPGPRVYV